METTVKDQGDVIKKVRANLKELWAKVHEEMPLMQVTKYTQNCKENTNL